METLATNLKLLALCAFIMSRKSRLNVFDTFRMEYVLRPLLFKVYNERARFDAGLDCDFIYERKLAFFAKYELPRIAETISLKW